MKIYTDTVSISPLHTLQDAYAARDLIREYGAATIVKDYEISFIVAADDDWDLCVILHEILHGLQANWSLDFIIKKEKVEEKANAL